MRKINELIIIGDALKEERQLLGMTQKQAAKQLRIGEIVAGPAYLPIRLKKSLTPPTQGSKKSDKSKSTLTIGPQRNSGSDKKMESRTYGKKSNYNKS